MIMLGYKDTVAVTMEDMIHHIRPVVKGAPDTFVVGYGLDYSGKWRGYPDIRTVEAAD